MEFTMNLKVASYPVHTQFESLLLRYEWWESWQIYYVQLKKKFIQLIFVSDKKCLISEVVNH